MNKIAIALAVASATALAAGTAGAAQLSQQDKSFLDQAAMSNLEEIQGGQLAVQHGTTPAIKQLGETLVTDHEQMNKELQQLAAQNGVTLPTQLPPDEKQELQQMSQLNGQQFDKKFAQDQVQDHQETIQKFQQEAQTTHDQQIKQLAEQSIPVLQKHLQMAQRAENSAG